MSIKKLIVSYCYCLKFSIQPFLKKLFVVLQLYGKEFKIFQPESLNLILLFYLFAFIFDKGLSRKSSFYYENV